jgi:sugar phosphate isomerase/epimerase
MKLGIFAKTFPGTSAIDTLSAAKQAGFSSVQYNMACSGLAPMPDRIDAAISLAVNAAARQTEVVIAAVSGTYNMVHPDRSIRQTGQKKLKVLAEQCHKMSTNVITLCTGTKNSEDQWGFHQENNSAESWRELLLEVELAVKTAEEHDVYLGIEPELANIVNSAAKAKMLLREIRSPRLKIVFDPANLFEREDVETQRRVVAEGVEMLADRIIMAHAKDRTPDGEFCAAGFGTIDFRHYLNRLSAAGFGGHLITHGLHIDEVPTVFSFLSEQVTRSLADG